MKNLAVFSEWKALVELRAQEQEQLLFAALDMDQNRMYFASSANIIYAITLPSFQVQQWASDSCLQVEVSLSETLEADEIIAGLEYLIEQDALVVGTSAGSFLLVAPASGSVQVLGTITGGVYSIAASPDGILLAVATGFGKLLVMNQDWDIQDEVSYDLEGDSETGQVACNGDGLSALSSTASKVQISWRGDGKFFATLSGKKTIDGLQRISVWERDSGKLHSRSESKDFIETAMDWMPSGAKIAAACSKGDGTCPSISFFERNGLERGFLDVNVAKTATIEMLKWNCNSELLAVVVKYDSRSALQIWFFSNYHWYLKQEWTYSGRSKLMCSWDPERPMHIICWTSNGLVHSLNLCWNSAVLGESMALVIDQMNLLVTPLSLACVPPPMSFFNVKFKSSVQSFAFTAKKSESQLLASLSDGSISVVKFPDIDDLEQLEGLSYESARVDTGGADIDFSSIRNLTWLDTNVFIGTFHLHVDEVQFFSNSIPDFKEKFYMKNETKRISLLLQVELGQSLNVMEPGCLPSQGWFVKACTSSILEKSVTSIVANPLIKGSAFIQFANGNVGLYNAHEGLCNAPAELYKEKLIIFRDFLCCCPWMQAVSVIGNGKLKALVVGLDENGRLQLNGQAICTDCTSFSFYSSVSGEKEQAATHLIYTTRNDLLFVVEVNRILHGGGSCDPNISEQMLPGVTNEIDEKSKAKGQESHGVLKVWERGAKLIGVINGDEAAVVLQTIRGNLEIIYPRKLVLLAIAEAMIEKRYKDAVSLVRRHRIDYNFLVDFCGWLNFIKVASDFVKQINNLNYITEFVCALKQENVMDTLYKAMSLPVDKFNTEGGASQISFTEAEGQLRNDSISQGFSDGAETKSMQNKVQAVLGAIRQALEKEVSSSHARELCILTTFARNDPPALEEALRRIKNLREEELVNLMKDDGCASDRQKLSADEAVKHLLWLSDAGAVFDAALGLYDLHLAAIVALNSQRDPKEFLPFLQELEQMPPSLMRYTIDCKLNRYESALKNIAAAGDNHFEECLDLMKKNPRLFSLGVDIFKDGKKRYVIFKMWGDHLLQEEKFEEAALAYSISGFMENALAAFRAGGFWKECLTAAGMLKYPEDEISRLANELREELQALGKPAEAAKIALDYCNDPQGAVDLLITARQWSEALRVGFLYNMGDLVTSQVKSSAIECANSFIMDYEQGIEKVKRYHARYLAVRQKRLFLAAKLQSEDNRNEDLEDDLASETSSNISGMSAYTLGRGSTTTVATSTVGKGSSAKTRDRKPRKPRGGKIRAGCPGEEAALVEHLQSMALSSQMQDDAKHLSETLIMLVEEETARKLQRIAGQYQSCQIDSVKEVEDLHTESLAKPQIKNLVELKNCLNSPTSSLWKWQILCRP